MRSTEALSLVEVMPAGEFIIPRASPDPQTVMVTFLAGKNEHTIDAYKKSLEDFARRSGAPTVDALVRALLLTDQGSANGLVLRYKGALISAHKSPATICQRLSAIRALVKCARMLGVVGWTIEVPSVPVVRLKDTRGPTKKQMREILRYVASQPGPRWARNYAFIRLMYDMGLRRKEACGLDLNHLDLEGRRVAILGKCRLEREWLSMPAPTAEAVRRWLIFRGLIEGPLLTTLRWNRDGTPRRFAGEAAARMVRELGAELGFRLRTHGFRHAAITRALDVTHGDIRRVRHFSRHKSFDMLLHYDDHRQNFAGSIAAKLAGEIRPPTSDPSVIQERMAARRAGRNVPRE